jgi:hypothetical protein
MLFQATKLLGKIKNKITRTPYKSLQQGQFKLALAAALAKILKAQKEKRL